MNRLLANYRLSDLFKSVHQINDVSRASLNFGDILAQGLTRGSLVMCCLAWTDKRVWLEHIGGEVAHSVPVDFVVTPAMVPFCARVATLLEECGYTKISVKKIKTIASKTTKKPAGKRK